MIDYEVVHRRSKKNKRIVLRVKPEGSVLVSRPYFSSMLQAERFVASKHQWILSQLSKVRPGIFTDLGRIGKTGLLHIEHTAEGRKARVVGQFNKTNSRQISSESDIYGLCLLFLKKEAHIYLKNRLEVLAKERSISFNEARVKDMTSRWGSCSSANNINLSVWLLELEDELIDYVIHHELTHIAHKNHGKLFWEDLTLAVPKAKTLSKKVSSFRPRTFYNAYV